MLPTHPLLTLSLLPLTSAWDFYANHTIGSCVEVECPAADPAEAKGQVLSGCRVQNQNHRTIGLRTFSTNITENTSQNLTWTVGMTLYDGIDAQGRNASGTRTVEKDYYLGTPANLNLSRSDLPYEGCAFLFRENKVTGPTSLGNAGPSCSDVVGDCGPALLTQARGLVANSSMMTAGDGNQTTEQTCTRLAAQFNSSLPGACETFAGQDRWNGITGITLTGPSAIYPPSPSANASSNCHPTLPKSNNLSWAAAYNQTGTYYAGSTIQMINGVDLVLTLFWSPDGDVQGALEEPDVDVECLWPIALNQRMLDTQADGGAVGVGWSWTAVVGAACVLFAGMLV
ncbi:hypothetical protein A1F94_001069 [Pyrenophora tritici-repentis]|nr:hypothetical protein A1F99_016890 [Pyrenophora tritici-repentis]KAG9388177.1 hypothetical protein A1F94_001069 [Pyrenophora tritici-repentis]PZD00930.1 hypothetical protein A1F95_02630 [Pyrenophora tritici-repentis]PZD30145.1 hypothetical protein A1F96_04607 [Pyrenophora tritici-repentis]